MKSLHLRLLTLFTFLLFSSFYSYATHYRAGEITYSITGNFQVTARCTTYTTVNSPADKDYVEIKWGDGAIDTIYRVNGNGENLGNNVQRNIFVGVHTYAGAPPPPNKYYIIGVLDPNRIDGINNIDNGNSVNIPFYVEDTLKFPTDAANIGLNNSPILLYPPIDYANVNDTFYHNPLAYDPDGDSLVFILKVPLQEQDLEVPLYEFPDLYCLANGVSNNTFTLNKDNGEIIWALPCQQGIFNIAILIKEYRGGFHLGTMIRDMQIIVLNNPNNPPQLSVVRDTCIRAGDSLLVNVSATDPNVTQTVTISANGGPFFVNQSKATFDSTQGNPASGIFRWTTVCSHIQKQAYTVLFRAADDYMKPGPTGPELVPLVDLETWQIHVIPPPVQNLTGVTTNSSVILNWDNPYLCGNDANFRGFSVWRKTGCDPFIPEYCEMGLAGRGYTKLTAQNIFTYGYTDFTTVVGQQYSYRVVAHFSKTGPNGLFQYDFVESVPSNEVCVFMPISVPVMLKADVQQTDVAAGVVDVAWSKPLAGGSNLDTLQFPPPYRFDLYRGSGFNLLNPVLIHSTPNALSFTALNDTTFTDTGINTQDSAWSYKVIFYSNNDTVGATSAASSVYLNVLPSDQSLLLTWNEVVPWTNDSFAIFRLNKLTSIYDSIAITTARTYTDEGLLNDSLYCYFVKSFGHYAINTLPKPLINKSQKDCAVPIDTVPPCPPMLRVTNDCEQYNNQPWTAAQFINYLRWNLPDSSCADDVAAYYIYRGDDDNSLAFVDSIASKADSSFNHVLTDDLAGCYAVTAVDRIGNQSAFSNVFCIDNCPYYVLPNTFTPNGDGTNEIFHPFKPYRFVPKIEMRIYNRWGEEVFKTEDPEIGWDGTDQRTGKPLSDGVYLYAGFYFEQRLGGLIQKPLSGQKKGGGFIHLIRGK
ncbi:MAG: gliding motility-associated C-terminal domain-containing protein [Chitinophagales bacterium]|nr:gliding motility-associated C-terminal domain-containing protein [Chitinophagales bacterium]